MKSILNEDSALKGLFDAISAVDTGAGKVKDAAKAGYDKVTPKGNSNYIGTSIASYSKNLVMSFPVLFDNTLSLETAQTISKANERNIVTMLQMMFASVNISSANGKEALAQFHKNINESESIEDIMDSVDAYLESQEVPEINKAELREMVNEIAYQAKKPQKSFPIDSFSEKALSEYTVSSVYGRTVVTEGQKYDPMYGGYDDSGLDAKASDKEEREKAKELREKDKAFRDANKDSRDSQKQFSDLARAQILDGDFKKANEVQPTTMIVNVNAIDPETGLVNRQAFIAGVKCRLIEASAMDIVERLVAKNKSKLSFKNLLRATTGEIHLVSDFLLCLKQAKINAKNAVKKGEAAKLWNTLERRSTKNSYNSIKKQSNDASAITTLVVNQETANYMKSAFNFDILKVADAKIIMSEYNLLCLIVADDSVEAAKFLYDGNNSYEVVSYSALQRDNKDDAYRKALNAVSRR